MVFKKEQIEEKLDLSSDETKWFEKKSNLPLLISNHYFALIENTKSDPIRKQVIPNVKEFDASDLSDPLEEEKHSVHKRLIHRYKNRAALLTTDKCFTYCRHCFRSRFTGGEMGAITKEELIEVCTYLKQHKEIKELLLTGGDLFTLSNDNLEMLFSMLKDARDDVIFRLCTRAVVTEPSRFTPELFSIISKYSIGAPFMLLTQFNHPREITKESLNVTNKFLSLSIPIFNQSVLLKSVNDDIDTLEELCNTLLYNKIKPYYLFQGDLVRGTKHLRVDITKGLKLEKELRNRLSGLAMPQYTIDLPQGAGKVILTEQYYLGLDDNKYVFTNYKNEKREYPKG